MSMSNKIRETFMLENAVGLDCIIDKIAKRTEQIFFRMNARRAFKSHELLVQQKLKVFGRLPVL